MDKLTELKAHAYDLLALIEQKQHELRQVNNEIGRIITQKNNEMPVVEDIPEKKPVK